MARDGEIIQRQHFLSSRRHNLPSKLRLRNDQTPRNVDATIIVDATIMRCFQAELFSCFLPPSYAGRASKLKDHKIGRSPYFYETKSGDFSREQGAS